MSTETTGFTPEVGDVLRFRYAQATLINSVMEIGYTFPMESVVMFDDHEDGITLVPTVEWEMEWREANEGADPPYLSWGMVIDPEDPEAHPKVHEVLEWKRDP